jgi:hypothetical protein
MPAFDLSKKTLRYAASDETALDKAVTLLGAMAEYDAAAKQDANTGLVALKALQKHVSAKRNPAPAKPAVA